MTKRHHDAHDARKASQTIIFFSLTFVTAVRRLGTFYPDLVMLPVTWHILFLFMRSAHEQAIQHSSSPPNGKLPGSSQWNGERIRLLLGLCPVMAGSQRGEAVLACLLCLALDDEGFDLAPALGEGILMIDWHIGPTRRMDETQSASVCLSHFARGADVCALLGGASQRRSRGKPAPCQADSHVHARRPHNTGRLLPLPSSRYLNGCDYAWPAKVVNLIKQVSPVVRKGTLVSQPSRPSSQPASRVSFVLGRE
ncbi:hypothetical protein B0T22DRAFT_254100 [Podospora appendiculata]|uniref:Uncharacterized protein n=1 Tax=Podospora appendiculata TaxID=314037 RepID=A0AAE0X2I0_9PEZI|nr:hypothetical protein B0T22DRAFT_254100 [Podospora appendiculata]